MSLPAHITDDCILQNLRRARDGVGEAMAYHYAAFLKEREWVDSRLAITPESEAELLRRAPV